MNFWKDIQKPVICLAPMADYTDSPFSRVCKKFGADIIYREMVSAEALIRENEKTLKMAEFKKEERPIMLQIFGKNPETMAKAAVILEKKFSPDGIDINMGCPARKIVSNFNGASLMREPKLASEIIKAVKAAVKMPVSVKTRTGWERDDEILKFAKIVEKAGADALAIHGRTKKLGYAGKANWEIIGRVKKESGIPVLLNGDVASSGDFRRALEISGADGVLIGRGALGRPWIFKDIKNNADSHPPAEELKKIILGHLELHLSRYGAKTPLRSIALFRKHLAAYLSGIKNAKEIRALAMAADSEKTLKKALALLR